MTDVDAIVAGLSEVERAVAIALIEPGLTHFGSGSIAPGISLMNGLGLMHIDVVKDVAGVMVRYRAWATATGLAVRAKLEADNG